MDLHPQLAAWLLGLEGIALLRHTAGDPLDGMSVSDRLAEVRRIIEATDFDAPLLEIGRTSTRDGYAKWAETYDDEANPLFGPDQAIVRPLLDSLDPGVTLDAACGTGRHGSYLADRGHRVVGVDLSEAMLARGTGARAQGDLRSLPLHDSSVDTVVCTLALTHLPDLVPAMSEFARIVRPGGSVITSDIHVLSLYLGGAPVADGKRLPASRFFASDYIHAATGAGLEVVSCDEPVWGVVEGEGGPLAQQWCPSASAAAYRDAPAAIVWHFRRPRPR